MIWRIFVADPAGGRSRYILYGAITGDKAKAEETARSLRMKYAQVYMYPIDTEVYDSYREALEEARDLFSRPVCGGADG